MPCVVHIFSCKFVWSVSYDSTYIIISIRPSYSSIVGTYLFIILFMSSRKARGARDMIVALKGGERADQTDVATRTYNCEYCEVTSVL